MYFDKQEFIALHKFSAYYASIMLNAFRHLLCSLLCQHNRRVPSEKWLYSYYSSPSNSVRLYTYVTASCLTVAKEAV